MKKILYLVLLVLLTGCSPAQEKITEITDTKTFEEISDKGIGWGIKKNINDEPDVPDDIKKLISKYDAFYMDNSGAKNLYLTFDEGYENGYTESILDTLNKHNVPAAFFVTGSYFDNQEELIKRMLDEGHIVGNHTENHPNLSRLCDDERISNELKALDDKFYEKFGIHMTYMRPPEGEFSERVLSVAKREGYKTAFWSFAYKDWLKDKEMGSEYAFDSITKYLHDGCVILLHAVSRDNAECLERVIDYAREMGYEFKSLDDIKL